MFWAWWLIVVSLPRRTELKYAPVVGGQKKKPPRL
jgi:hypothetical protein